MKFELCQAASYQLNKAYMLTTFFEIGNKDHTEANFVIPGLQRLASDSRAGNLHIIIVSSGRDEILTFFYLFTYF
jgi:hypothetical protein